MTKTYTVETIGKVIVILTDKDLATIFYEQHKDDYTYVTLNEVVSDTTGTKVTSLAITHR